MTDQVNNVIYQVENQGRNHKIGHSHASRNRACDQAAGIHSSLFYANKSNKGGDGSKSSGISKADVAALIREHDKKKQKEAKAKADLNSAMVQELRGLIQSQVASALANAGVQAQSQQKRGLVRSGAYANVASTQAEAARPDETEAVQQCAANLLLKFSKIGSKAPSKSGH